MYILRHLGYQDNVHTYIHVSWEPGGGTSQKQFQGSCNLDVPAQTFYPTDRVTKLRFNNSESPIYRVESDYITL